MLASNEYRELGLFEAQALEEIEPEDKTRNEVLCARIDIYLALRNGTWRTAVARHLVKAPAPVGLDRRGCFLISEELR